MTAPLSAALTSRLQGEPTQQIADRLGIDPAQAAAAIGAALPLLLGALGRNASQPQGAQALYGALQKDHTGLDVGSVLGSVLGGGGQGGQILGHVFGDRQPRAAQVLGQSTGIGNDKANMLLRWLAPIALAYIAKRVFERRQAASGPMAATGAASSGAASTDATSTGVDSPVATTPSSDSTAPAPQVLGEVLGPETAHAQRQGGLLGAVFDRDGDGDVDFSDLLKAGGSLLGGTDR